MNPNDQIEDDIRTRIQQMFLSSDGTTLESDTELLEVLDSLQVLRLVIELESMYAIKVGDADLTLENLGTVRRIASLVRRKKQIADQKMIEPLAQGA